MRTDRSRIAAYRNCPRLRWWNYHYGGTGIEPVQRSLPLAFGIGIHDALAALLEGRAADAVIADMRAEFQQLVDTRGVDEPEPPEHFVAEQQCLLEGLIRAWLRVRYPRIKDEYEVVTVEHELLWDMGGDVQDMVRADAVLRRRADGALFYWEVKTTSSGNDEWIKGWNHNSQMLANVLALEETLHLRIDGVLIEGILKGRRLAEKAACAWQGAKVQQSPLCYGWIGRDGTPSPNWSNGATRIAVWQHGDVEAWVSSVLSEAECRALFIPVPPVLPARHHLERWRRQAVLQEQRIAEALATGPNAVAFDAVFPLNDDHCYRYWGRPCVYEACCFTSAIGEAPLESGLYQRRTPHHDLEDSTDA